MNGRLVVVAATLVLAGCPAGVDEPGGGAEPDPQVATCSLGGLEANPAGLHRSGSVGGVALRGDPELASSDVVPVGAAAAAAGDPFVSAGPRQDVVLLVADDFGAVEGDGVSIYRLGPEVYATSYRQYLIASENAELTYPSWLEQHLDGLVTLGQLSHGALVLTHALDLLAELGAVVAEDTDTRVRLGLGDAEVIVEAVEVAGLTAQQVRAALEQVTDAYRSVGYERFVVNMSFTLEPCETIREFRRRGEATFDAYLAASPPSLGPGDPLYEYVHEDTRDTVFVAAAGNYGGDQPRQPGLMPQVVSVSAARGAANELFTQSNGGEVMAPGVWVPLRNPYGRNDEGASPSGEVLLGGTSLAAPVVAVASVLDAGAEVVRCADASLGSRLAHGAHTNAPLTAAVEEHCLAAP